MIVVDLPSQVSGNLAELCGPAANVESFESLGINR